MDPTRSGAALEAAWTHLINQFRHRNGALHRLLAEDVMTQGINNNRDRYATLIQCIRDIELAHDAVLRISRTRLDEYPDLLARYVPPRAGYEHLRRAIRQYTANRHHPLPLHLVNSFVSAAYAPDDPPVPAPNSIIAAPIINHSPPSQPAASNLITPFTPERRTHSTTSGTETHSTTSGTEIIYPGDRRHPHLHNDPLYTQRSDGAYVRRRWF